MRDDREQWLQQRAYAIWEAEGRPDGRDRVHWEQAEGELAANQLPNRDPDFPDAAPEPGPDKKPRKRTTVKLSASGAGSGTKKAAELRQ